MRRASSNIVCRVFVVRFGHYETLFRNIIVKLGGGVGDIWGLLFFKK